MYVPEIIKKQGIDTILDRDILKNIVNIRLVIDIASYLEEKVSSSFLQ